MLLSDRLASPNAIRLIFEFVDFSLPTDEKLQLPRYLQGTPFDSVLAGWVQSHDNLPVNSPEALVGCRCSLLPARAHDVVFAGGGPASCQRGVPGRVHARRQARSFHGPVAQADLSIALDAGASDCSCTRIPQYLMKVVV